ncbi:MAG: PhnD/SsuA/transferrin family substrate-binding protein [Chloroflexi bacterium]|nr:PhnD/SsuA/transferrin family substrate-binding protein [Chloroflexota bacterium]
MTAFTRRNLYWTMILIVLAYGSLAGCRRLVVVPPTERPTTTPTPRSTHLPPAATPLPLGSEQNPVHVLFPIIESGRSEQSIASAADELAPELAQSSGLAVEVRVVQTDAEALAELCASTPEQVTVAWLSGVGYAAAYAQGCGSAALHVRRGERDQASAGMEVVLYGSRAAGGTSLENLESKRVCRLGVDDLNTWLIPLLLLRGGGEELMASLTVEDYEDLDAILVALDEGDCAAAGMSAADFAERASAALRASVVTLAESAEIPFSVLVIPDFLPLGQANALIDAFTSIGNGARSSLLSPLLLQNEIAGAEDADFARLRAFFSQAGINLADLGS